MFECLIGKIAKLKMIIFVAIPANRLNKKNNRLQFNKSSAFVQLNIIHSSALEYNTQVKSQHLYLEVYLQKASSIISNYHFMMRKSHSLKQQHRSLSEAQEISGAIVFFISLSPRSLLLSQKMRSSLRRWGGGGKKSTMMHNAKAARVYMC